MSEMRTSLSSSDHPIRRMRASAGGAAVVVVAARAASTKLSRKRKPLHRPLDILTRKSMKSGRRWTTRQTLSERVPMEGAVAGAGGDGADVNTAAIKRQHAKMS